MKEKNEPLEITLEQLKHSLIVHNNEYRYINPDFGIVISSSKLESNLVKAGQPYRAKEGRIIRSLHGKARISVNLIEYDIDPQMIIVTPPDSIIQIINFSPDYDFQMIATNSSFLPIPHKEDLADSYMQQGIVIKPTDEEWDEISMYFSLIWKTVQEPVFRREVVLHLLTALLYNKKVTKQYRTSPFAPRRIVPSVHRLSQRIQQRKTHCRILCRQIMPHTPLSEYRYPSSEPPHSDGLDKPSRDTRSTSFA